MEHSEKRFVDELRKDKNKDRHKNRHEHDEMNAAAVAAETQATPVEATAENNSSDQSVWAEIEAILDEQPSASQTSGKSSKI